ncbi:GntR family transcriptional regulator [Macrococcoides caseolyticum]|uniref:GntR family transcriptional regulator n=1 Tax=Macrococcoides caseolyticum TaxID=69966 RepID=UPI001F491E78|nr:GntR family transcriptional regulator [Macrococcus caseolyticus]MCE4956018.1 GntR family transcriptional regulator [Macrococcus caseolyticus]
MGNDLLNDLLQNVISGQYYSQKLESEHTLSEQYGMTRVDVRKVLSQLEEMGYIHSKQGIGRFYRDKLPVIELALSGTVSFTDKMLEQGYDFKTENIGFRCLRDDEVTSELSVLGNGPYYEVKRLRLVHGIPVAIHASIVSGERFKSIGEMGQEITSLYHFYQTQGYHHLQATETKCSVGFPLKSEQERLKCHSLVPLLILEAMTVDTSGHYLDSFKTVYRTDLFKFIVS